MGPSPDAVRMGVNDPTLRDEFDRVAQELQVDGTYDAIYEKYLLRLGGHGLILHR